MTAPTLTIKPIQIGRATGYKPKHTEWRIYDAQGKPVKESGGYLTFKSQAAAQHEITRRQGR